MQRASNLHFILKALPRFSSHYTFSVLFDLLSFQLFLVATCVQEKGRKMKGFCTVDAFFQASKTPPRAPVPRRLIVAIAAKCGDTFCTNIFQFPLLHVFVMRRHQNSGQQYYYTKLLISQIMVFLVLHQIWDLILNTFMLVCFWTKSQTQCNAIKLNPNRIFNCP